MFSMPVMRTVWRRELQLTPPPQVNKELPEDGF